MKLSRLCIKYLKKTTRIGILAKKLFKNLVIINVENVFFLNAILIVYIKLNKVMCTCVPSTLQISHLDIVGRK